MFSIGTDDGELLQPDKYGDIHYSKPRTFLARFDTLKYFAGETRLEFSSAQLLRLCFGSQVYRDTFSRVHNHVGSIQLTCTGKSISGVSRQTSTHDTSTSVSAGGVSATTSVVCCTFIHICIVRNIMFEILGTSFSFEPQCLK